ncbi:putative signal transducing protein [Prosthecobacter sp.]|uniref:putative signal transducing protein n=1 Tax=Prosthecobacter sp. TaxID=1965333 RepID=UPI0037833DA8
MTPVFADPDSTRVGFAKSILESAGIESFVQNENTRTLGPKMFGFSETMLNEPQLCVVDDARAEEAAALLREHFGSASDAGEWICAGCKESNPGSFEECWKCQAAKPE